MLRSPIRVWKLHVAWVRLSAHSERLAVEVTWGERLLFLHGFTR